MTAQLAMLNGMEVVAILGICLVLFGAKKLPELAQGLGKGLREFKKAANDLTDEAMNMATESLPPPKSTPALPAAPQADSHLTAESSHAHPADSHSAAPLDHHADATAVAAEQITHTPKAP
jgi:sec-independent protein translocase protein TatA